MAPATRWHMNPSYRLLLEAIESLNCGLLAYSANAKILFANSRLLDWVGYSPEEIEGSEMTILVPEEFRHLMDSELERNLKGDERARIGALQRKDGSTFPVVGSPHVIREDDTIVAIITVIMDLGAIQTARHIGTPQQPGLSGSLARIANELQTISLFAHTTGSPIVPHDHPDLQTLSNREREILAELLSGDRPPAIAKKLFISPHTVRNHLKSMYRKLDVSSQAELIERVRTLTGG